MRSDTSGGHGAKSLGAQSLLLIGLIASTAIILAGNALADPCGMVPPIYIQDNSSLVRVGDQQTYVFHKDGLETFVIRPGFSGKVEDFGMLIPFPTPPALRKAPENIFAHIAAAVDPPEVVVYVGRNHFAPGRSLRRESKTSAPAPDKMMLKKDQVRVLREEAVGMYEVAVLEAGSAAALKRWLEDHKYKYPDGMDTVCSEYVDLGWCFVAVKAKVGGKAGVDPQPGKKRVDTKLPSGSTFDGHVQAMGFRFKTDKLIVPMRLSAFNEGELRNIVYLLTDSPRKIRSIPEEYVVRQISGEELFRNVTRPLPLRIIGGTAADIPQRQMKSLSLRRNPAPHNGNAKQLFAGDMLAVKKDRLSHPHEEAEKMLLRIGEHFGLRGPAVDKENVAALAKQREQAVKEALEDVKKMTLTVIDGDFPREVLAGQNLVFSQYNMPPRRNTPEYYDAKLKKPSGKRQGVLKLGQLDAPGSKRLSGSFRRGSVLGVVVSLTLAVAILGLTLALRGSPMKQ